MNQNNLKIIGIFCCLFLFACTSTKDLKKDTSKNILFIAVDDLKPLLNCYGAIQMHTPNFDRLAKIGVSFTNAHVQQAVCGPSRASIMTATYPDRNKVWDLHSDFRELSLNLISMPEYLISQGYTSEALGKIYHYNSASPNHDGKSWTKEHFVKPDDYQPLYGSAPFAYWMDKKLINKRDALLAEAKSNGILAPKKQMSYAMKRLKPSTEALDAPDEIYPDGLIANEAVKRLGDLKNAKAPFFLAVGFIKPHLPFNAPKKYWDLYDRDKIDLAPFRQLAEGTPELAYHSFGEIRSYSDIENSLGVGTQMTEEKQRELIHGYMACVSYIDAQLGKLLDALEDNNLDKNSLIVLWGDHGYHLGDHTIWCKHSNFEQATRIPLMFAGAGVAKNKQSNHPVELVDVFPTLFDLAGIPIPKQAEGKSLVPLVDSDSKTTLSQDYALSQYHRGKYQLGFSIRTENYRYTEWYKYKNEYRTHGIHDERKTIARELYDYKKDPYETKNLIGNTTYKQVETNLKEKLQVHLEGRK